MKRSEAGLLFLIFMTFISIPILPHTFYSIINHFIFNLIFIFVIVYAFSSGGLFIGLPVFFVIGALVIERNHRIWIWTKQQLRAPPASPAPRMKEDEEMPVSAEVYYAPAEIPREDYYNFRPADDSGTNYFEPVGSSINYKKVMETIPLGQASANLFSA
jgi:hypothetical protein